MTKVHRDSIAEPADGLCELATRCAGRSA